MKYYQTLIVMYSCILCPNLLAYNNFSKHLSPFLFSTKTFFHWAANTLIRRGEIYQEVALLVFVRVLYKSLRLPFVRLLKL